MPRGKSLIPKSKAKTAYGLLSEIRALILAEPLRYDQRDILTIVPASQRDKDTPACGTIGCVAGWVCALKNARAKVLAETPCGGVNPVLIYAAKKLGLNDWQRSELFGPFRAGMSDRGPSHARAGAEHIRKFQSANRHQLLAKKV